MLSAIIKKELLNALRDVRFQVSGILLVGLMIASIVMGKQAQQRIQQEREAAQKEMYESWLNQGNKHPHSAAHYGHFAFKPKPVLSFLDAGLDNFTGVSIFLEAHKQNEVLFSGAQEGGSINRFGVLSSAMIFQLLFPLLIIFLTFSTFTKEREEGLLTLIMAQGVSLRTLYWGKVLSTYGMVLFLFVPVTLLAYFFLDNQLSSFDPQLTLKFLLLLATYAAYFLVFIMLAVLISAFSKNSTTSLLSLLAVWITAGIILPKATANLADKLYPAPSQFEFKQVISDKVKNGIDGHNPSDERFAALKQEVLDRYQVATVEELPVNWGGIAMQAGEEYTDQVYDQEFSKVEAIFRKQNRLSEWMSFLDPYLAIRHLSMGLAGTDYHHHVAFAKAAESYRRYFVKYLNKDMEVNHQYNVAYDDYKVATDFWAEIKPISYRAPTVSAILSQHWEALAALTCWVLLLALLAHSSLPTISKL
ncbi:MAG: ABC transporter permease [Thermonemataceae bacterium]